MPSSGDCARTHDATWFGHEPCCQYSEWSTYGAERSQARSACTEESCTTLDHLSNREVVIVRPSSPPRCLYGRQRMEHLWSRAVATSGNRGKWDGPENGQNSPKPLPWVATSCDRAWMVRRGSTVRVRQRALQKAAQIGAISLSKQLAQVPVCGRYGAPYGAFKAGTPLSPSIIEARLLPSGNG
jgi:hypothetical protein